MINLPNIWRIKFFENQVHQQIWKDQMCGKNEERCIKIFESLGYIKDQDYVRQYPIGERFVLDFAFIKERVAVEVDGKNHRQEKQRKIDEKRDRYLYSIGWIPIRVKDDELFGQKGSFTKILSRRLLKKDEFNIKMATFIR